MEWHDRAFVLAARRHGENGAIVELLTEQHGRHAGLVRGGQSLKLRAVLQPGNEVAAVWRGRLSEHLGTITGELVRPHAAGMLDDPDRLAGLTAAASLVAAALPEREPYPDVFASFGSLLRALEFGSPLAGELCRVGARLARSARVRSGSQPLRGLRRDDRPRLCFAPHRARNIASGRPAISR